MRKLSADECVLTLIIGCDVEKERKREKSLKMMTVTDK